jgi:type II secretory pathway pseudopilin PulG
VLIVVVAVFLAYGLLTGLVSSVDAGAKSRAAVEAARVTQAQLAYARSNGGFFDERLECLSTPDVCIPKFTGPPFLEPRVSAELTARLGRGRWFYAGAKPSTDELNRGQAASLSSVKSFAFLVSVGERPWWTKLSPFGEPALLCGDSSGQVCRMASRDVTAAAGGRCPAGCTP